MAWPELILQITGKLKDDFLRLNSYFSAAKTVFDGHIAGTADKHAATKITHDATGKTKITGTDVQAAIDQVEIELQNFVDVNVNAEIGDARISTTKEKAFVDIRARFEEGEQDYLEHSAENVIQFALKADKAYVDTQIASVASASPKGTYATSVDLQTALPSGDTGIYVVSADGNWYYWSGSAWIAGGIYQSTGIADGAVTASALGSELLLLQKGLNLIYDPKFTTMSELEPDVELVINKDIYKSIEVTSALMTFADGKLLTDTEGLQEVPVLYWDCYITDDMRNYGISFGITVDYTSGTYRTGVQFYNGATVVSVVDEFNSESKTVKYENPTIPSEANILRLFIQANQYSPATVFQAYNPIFNIGTKLITLCDDTYYRNVIDEKTVDIAYVSTSGNDSNDGSETSPLATIEKAYSIGAKEIRLYGGTEYRLSQTLAVNRDLKIEAIKTASGLKSKIYGSKRLLLISHETIFKTELALAPIALVKNDIFKLTSVATLELCMSTVDSYYYSVGTATVYINVVSGDTVDNVLLDKVISVTSGDFGISSCTVLHGLTNVFVGNANVNNVKSLNCDFHTSIGETAVLAGGNGYFEFENCDFAYSYGNDGVAPRDNATVVLKNCNGHDNFDEGCSSHNKSKTIVNGGKYYNNGYIPHTQTAGAPSNFGGVNLSGGGLGEVYNVESFNNRTFGIAPIDFMVPSMESSCSIHHNHCWGNGEAGICLTANSDTQCYENLIHNNADGIKFKKEPSYATKVASKAAIYANKIYDNTGNGIRVDIEEIADYDLDIRRNEIINNGVAISMASEDYIFELGENTLRANASNFLNVKTADQDIQYIIS